MVLTVNSTSVPIIKNASSANWVVLTQQSHFQNPTPVPQILQIINTTQKSVSVGAKVGEMNGSYIFRNAVNVGSLHAAGRQKWEINGAHTCISNFHKQTFSFLGLCKVLLKSEVSGPGCALKLWGEWGRYFLLCFTGTHAGVRFELGQYSSTDGPADCGCTGEGAVDGSVVTSAELFTIRRVRRGEKNRESSCK